MIFLEGNYDLMIVGVTDNQSINLIILNIINLLRLQYAEFSKLRYYNISKERITMHFLVINVPKKEMKKLHIPYFKV